MKFVLHMSFDDLLGWIIIGLLVVAVLVLIVVGWVQTKIQKVKTWWKKRKEAKTGGSDNDVHD